MSVSAIRSLRKRDVSAAPGRTRSASTLLAAASLGLFDADYEEEHRDNTADGQENEDDTNGATIHFTLV